MLTDPNPRTACLLVVAGLHLAAVTFALEREESIPSVPSDHLPSHVLVAPRPKFPYDVPRSIRFPRAGIIRLRVDFQSGLVIHAEMVKATGSPIFDKSALDAGRRWRFEPHTTTRVDVPVCFEYQRVLYGRCPQYAPPRSSPKKTAKAGIHIGVSQHIYVD